MIVFNVATYSGDRLNTYLANEANQNVNDTHYFAACILMGAYSPCIHLRIGVMDATIGGAHSNASIRVLANGSVQVLIGDKQKHQ